MFIALEFDDAIDVPLVKIDCATDRRLDFFWPTEAFAGAGYAFAAMSRLDGGTAVSGWLDS